MEAPRWAAGCVFRSFGVRVGVRVNRPEIFAACTALFPPGWKPARDRTLDRLYSLVVAAAHGAANGHPSHALYADGKRITTAATLEALLDAFENDLHQQIATLSPQRLFVHAGVVGWRGKAIVIPGRSFTGKTSLVAALVKAGATYYSDEFAVLDARGRVHPFARPLAIRDAQGRQHRVAVAELGGRAGRTPLAIGAVVVAPYKAGACWQTCRLSAGQGILALLAETVAVRRQPQRTLEVLRAAVAGAPVFRGVRGEAGETVQSLLATVAQVKAERRRFGGH